jgi:hypothetical protein
VLAAVLGGGAVVIVVAGCGGGSRGGAAATSGGDGARVNRFTSFDAVSGKVIAASATSASVQQTSGPASVVFGSATRFTATTSTSRSALADGDCVMVAGAAASSGGGPRASVGSPPSVPTTLTARTVTVTSRSGCQREANFPDRGRRFTGTPRAGGFPPPTARSFTGTPPAGGFGAGRGPGSFRGRVGRGVLGTVSSIDAHSFVVTAAFGTGAKTTVKTTSATTYAATDPATAANVTKGACLNAVGSIDVSGVLQARSVAISPPVNGECRAAPVAFVGGPPVTTGGGGGA